MGKFTKFGQSTHKGIVNWVSRRPLNSSTEIRLTYHCTQRCRQCRVYEKGTQPSTMSLADFKQIASKLREYGAYIGFISGGEATLVPHLDEILLEAKKTFALATTLVSGLYNRTPVIERIGRLALENDIHIQTSLDGLGELGDYLRGSKDFSKTVLEHMKRISEMKGNSRSILYANIVLNNLNLEQVPELLKRIRDIGWKATIGVYHTLTPTTRFDRELTLRSGKRLDRVLNFLVGNSDILNLDSFIQGIGDFVAGVRSGFCPFVDSWFLSTRTTIMEDGSVHLCKGRSIGNLLDQSLAEIFSGGSYRKRLMEYQKCSGCWTTCYTQRYLLVRPRSGRELFHAIKKLAGLTESLVIKKRQN